MANTTLQLNELPDSVDLDLGQTEWMVIDQERVNAFADATGDHQWIHVDPERAKAESPYGTTIAHGYLTLSLCNLFLPQLLKVEGASMGVNYGSEKVRYPAPVRVGSKIRGTGQIIGCTEVPGGQQVTIRITVEVEGEAKPACVVDTVNRWLA